jgi:hypothetical protein
MASNQVVGGSNPSGRAPFNGLRLRFARQNSEWPIGDDLIGAISTYLDSYP